MKIAAGTGSVDVILRVIAGIARGHKLKTPGGMSTRPTTDRVKESLFGILTPWIVDAEVLDLFAGTGSLGIEALSRGAEKAVFVDKSRVCCDIVRENLGHTKLADSAEVIPGEAQAVLNRLAGSGRSFDIVFLDPPYHRDILPGILEALDRLSLVKQEGIVVTEHDAGDPLPEETGSLARTDTRKYGDTVLSFYRRK